MWRKVVFYLAIMLAVMLVFILLALASGLPWWSVCIMFVLAVGWVALTVVVLNILYKIAKWADII